jgi:site-specific recombinase XerD
VAANSNHFFSRHALMWGFFSESCGVCSISDLRLEHVTRFIQHRIGQGRSASTVNGSLSLLRCFLLYVQEDGVPIHPSLEHIQRLKDAERLPRYIASTQVQRVREAVEAGVLTAHDQEKRHDALLVRAVFHLLWQGGLRVGEVEELRFSDFYIATATQAQRLFVRDGKWRKGRAVYLTDVQLAALRAYLAVRGSKRVGGYVFVRKQLPLKRGYLAQRLRALGRQVGVVLSPHRLRHTFGSQLLNVGCPVTSIQKLLGHESLNTTMVYARLFDETVMRDYFKAVDVIETQPGGAWFAIDAPV